MSGKLITEEDYRETLRCFIKMISGEESYSEEKLTELIYLLETYEYENC